MRWRTGLGAATARERIALQYAERIARSQASCEWYEDRCLEVGSYLVDAADLTPRSVRLEWCRGAGNLYVVCSVHNRSARRVRRFAWRLAMPSTSDRAFNLMCIGWRGGRKDATLSGSAGGPGPLPSPARADQADPQS